jgi:acyl-coenzyme A synthetase/AMP-(fatty) acid ligase
VVPHRRHGRTGCGRLLSHHRPHGAGRDQDRRFKVGAGEIEDVLRGHAEVADVAVTSEPDPDLGQRIVAWIVPRAGCTPSRAALEALVADALTPYKRPRVIHFLDDLPRNSMGKVEKRKLGVFINPSWRRDSHSTGPRSAG